MKTLFLSFVLVATFATAYGQEENPSNSTVYIVRSTGFGGSLRQFKIFVDGKLVCKMSNKKYTLYNLSPGTHEFAVQLDGKKLKQKTEKIKLTTDANGTYYLVVDKKSGFVSVKTFFTKSEKESAEKIIAKTTQLSCAE